MSDFIGVYGFGMTRPMQVGSMAIEPCFIDVAAARRSANDPKQFFLTAVGLMEEGSDERSLFDLAASMTFCQQRWVIVTGPFRMPSGTALDDFRQKVPDTLEFQPRRESGGPLVMEDAFAPGSRQDFLDICLRRLRDESFLQGTGFREAFFRTVEVLRMDPAYVDVTYYLHFSAVEILARTIGGDPDSSFSKVATSVLRNLGFDVVQDNPALRIQSMETYARLRNALFHNGKFEVRFNENGREVLLKLTAYEDFWHRLVPDVLLKVLEFDDGRINWNRWLDRMPFVTKQK